MFLPFLIILLSVPGRFFIIDCDRSPSMAVAFLVVHVWACPIKHDQRSLDFLYFWQLPLSVLNAYAP